MVDPRPDQRTPHDHSRGWLCDPTATIDDGAVVGDGSRLWHHVHVRSGARIGVECSLGKNVYVDAGVTIGDRVKVQNNVSIYAGVTIGDDVFLGPSCVFTNDRYPRAHGAAWQLALTDVRQGASVGANATVVCGTTIGAWAVVGAGAVVTHDVLDHELVVGNPARHAGWVCTCGRVVSRAPTRPTELRCAECLAMPA